MGFWSDARDGLARFFTAGKRREARRRAAWSAAAERHGGAYSDGVAKFLRWQSPIVEAPVGDALVHVDILVQRAGQVTVIYTRFRARFALGVGPAFKVGRNRAASKLATALGFQDEPTGDPAFDEAFVVRTPAPDAMREAWSARARELMTGIDQPGYFAVTSDGHTITVLVQGWLEAEAALTRGIGLTGELASWGRAALAALDFEGAERAPATGPWDDRTLPAARLVFRDTAVRVEPLVEVLEPRLRAVAEGRDDGPTLAFAIDRRGAAAPAPPAGALGPNAAELVARLGPARVSYAGGPVHVLLEGALSPARARDAAELAAWIAVGEIRQGTFR